ncbi:N6-adenosine-methyltransferase subunit METTL3 [Thrips palmi]|uniref:mRNA m(6)A methyltransferase n=1 Tax=Thrips palmi TaxID=161013 RepID=A0A6P8ZXK4_THRPL|nr:N6-adenosine-methyltransferase subunit METTL3 [Thrips palmi]XP_034250147.1 N6-adenosine-methyltransferase subunit METTL3 [Thrips palmi]XP_034250154.1 N6-adenosine-methyltransferase subunit METTL3 [Thrips palmi]
MSDAWEDLQALKSKRNSLREKLQKRKKEREDILNRSGGPLGGPEVSPSSLSKSLSTENKRSPSSVVKTSDDLTHDAEIVVEPVKTDPAAEKQLLRCLSEVSLTLPSNSEQLAAMVGRPLLTVTNLLQKFATQQLISIKDGGKDGFLEVVSAEHSKLSAMVLELAETDDDPKPSRSGALPSIRGDTKRKGEELGDEPGNKAAKISNSDKDDTKKSKDPKAEDIMSLLSMPSIKEKESKKMGEEILDLLSKPTAKERSLTERFRSQGGAQVMEFCPHGTKAECAKVKRSGNGGAAQLCKKLHFKKIIQQHTDETLGDCSFLNTCFHMDTCKYVHYEVDGPTVLPRENYGGLGKSEGPSASKDSTILYPPQWVQCDLRYLDMRVLGKFAVIMADPPWDIHMELPYGTMSDDEMRQLGIPTLQDDGLIFLWVTGRAMELGRECLKLWGYERVDEIIWVKTNQLQRIIRTGRTGHWLNHGKEHCLVGMKGSPDNLNRGLDCDVIVAEVRATSHKPDEIYGIIERLSPGTRKIELFGRPHNVQPNWITLGNQVDGVRLVDPELIKAFRERYPDGNCMTPPKT